MPRVRPHRRIAAALSAHLGVSRDYAAELLRGQDPLLSAVLRDAIAARRRLTPWMGARYRRVAVGHWLLAPEQVAL
jgi:hypothetical protein